MRIALFELVKICNVTLPWASFLVGDLIGGNPCRDTSTTVVREELTPVCLSIGLDGTREQDAARRVS